MKHTKAEIFEAARANRIPAGPVNSMAELMESRLLKERGFFIDVEHSETGKLTYPGAPYKFSETPWAIRRPAPILGQHNVDVYCSRLGYTKKELVKMYETGII
jgi:crotonobetainyl-CoA:carnitine CoA-transferase CaiB-like acyl-CoA transferase